jgi:predicted DNA-binding protein (MmcQ/YjbR family)
MDLSELVQYAKTKYGIQEYPEWNGSLDYSVLSNPNSERWMAYLFREKDPESGSSRELCDMKCSRQSLPEPRPSYISGAFRMTGPDWIGLTFDGSTDPETVFRLFDEAMSLTSPDAFTIILDDGSASDSRAYQDTLLTFSGKPPARKDRSVPERIREMKALYEPGDFSFQQKCRNFYVQGKFMEDYEDDAPWDGEFRRYFTTYHDLRVDQLRGYFTWRTRLRHGIFEKTPTSFQYLYLYELLNGIGASSPEDTVAKMTLFESGFLNSGIGDVSIRTNLRRWMLEFSVLNDMDMDVIRQCLDPKLMKSDLMLSVLRDPGDHSDEEIFEALLHFAEGRSAVSPAVKKDPGTVHAVTAAAWRIICDEYSVDGEPFFQYVFGRQEAYLWHPLDDAVYYQPPEPSPKRYTVNGCREFEYRDGMWTERRFYPSHFDKKVLAGFMHEADRQLRSYVGAGSGLKKVPEEARFEPFVSRAIEADRKEKAEARRLKITIDYSDLDRIRDDAGTTRDSLLTEEELMESMEVQADEEVGPPATEALQADLGLSDVQLRVLRMVLAGESVRDTIASEHGMPEIYADTINEAFFEEVGDSVVECDGQDIILVEDYREDVERILKGSS